MSAALENGNGELAREKTNDVVGVAAVNDGSSSGAASMRSEGGRSTYIPLRMKIISIILVTAIGFGSHWSSGVTGAMKSTLKKVCAVFCTRLMIGEKVCKKWHGS